jgi:16S rRNA G1207 methylase RsmC
MKYQIDHNFRGINFRLTSVAGLYGRDAIPDATQYLLNQVPEEDLGRILDLGCGYGTIGISLAPQSGETHMVDSDLRAYRCAEINLKNHGISAKLQLDDHLGFLPDLYLDHVFFNPPVNQGAELITALILEALSKLKRGGKLWIVAKKDKGVARYAKILRREAGACEVIFRKRGYQVLLAEKLQDSSFALEDFRHTVLAQGLEFQTEAGLFSRKEEDPGSSFLLSTLDSPPRGRILDLGCGYGLLGLSLAHKTGQDALLVDVDYRAVRLTRENIAANNLKQAQALHSDGYSGIPPEEKFALILSNPPFHQGQEVIAPFLTEARKRLRKKGLFAMVIMRPEYYQELLKQRFSTVLRFDQGEYTVLKALP